MTGPDAVTEDGWLGGALRLSQPKAGYRVAIDAALLAAAVAVGPGGRALEFGTGVGAAALALAWRLKDVQIDAVEVQAPLAALARRNVALNGLEGRVRIIEGDLAAVPLDARAYDAVYFNPPYLKPGDNDPAPDPVKRIATVEGEVGLPAWFAAAARSARAGGAVVAIHRADRLGDLLAAAAAAGVGGLTVFPLWPKVGEPAARVLVSGRAGKGGRLTLAPGLILHEADGAYTAAARAALTGSALKLG